MSFAAIAPILGSLAGGFLGKKLGGPTNEQKQVYNLLNYNAQKGSRDAEAVQGMGSDWLNRGMGYFNRFNNTLAGPQNYFQSLLSGSPQATTAALAPDIARIRGGTQEALQAGSTLAPRGAGRSGTLFNLPFQAQAQTSGLFNSLRPQAAQALTGIAGMQGQVGQGVAGLGANLYGLAPQFLNIGNNAARYMGDMGGDFYKQQYEAGKGAGGGITDLLKGINWGKIFGRGGGGGNSTTTIQYPWAG